MGWQSTAGLPPALNSLVPIYTTGWREALWEKSVLPKDTTQCPRPGLEPGPLVTESSPLTMRPRPPLHPAETFSNHCRHTAIADKNRGKIMGRIENSRVLNRKESILENLQKRKTLRLTGGQIIDCKTVVFFASTSDGPYSNERYRAIVNDCLKPGNRRPESGAGNRNPEPETGIRNPESTNHRKRFLQICEIYLA